MRLVARLIVDLESPGFKAGSTGITESVDRRSGFSWSVSGGLVNQILWASLGLSTEKPKSHRSKSWTGVGNPTLLPSQVWQIYSSLPLCPFWFSKVKPVSFWKGKYILHRLSTGDSWKGWFDSEKPIRFVFGISTCDSGQGSSRQLHVRHGFHGFRWLQVSEIIWNLEA